MNRFERRKQTSILKKIKPSIIDLTKYSVSELPSKGVSMEKCYANSLKNCDGGISREHYISFSILKQIGTISAKGIPWLSHLETDLSAESLVSKCLCRRHNNVLSPIDEMAGKIFSAVKDFGNRKDEITLIPGLVFERWILKLLFGMLGTDKVNYKDQVVAPDEIDKLWINVLYGISPMPKDCGLYVCFKPGDLVQFRSQILIEFLFIDQLVAGIKINFAGFQFWFSMVPKEKSFKKEHPDYDSIIYRPRSFNKNPYPQELRFNWP